MPTPIPASSEPDLLTVEIERFHALHDSLVRTQGRLLDLADEIGVIMASITAYHGDPSLDADADDTYSTLASRSILRVTEAMSSLELDVVVRHAASADAVRQQRVAQGDVR